MADYALEDLNLMHNSDFAHLETRKALIIGAISSVIIFSTSIIVVSGAISLEILSLVLAGIAGIVITLKTLREPYLGLAFMVAGQGAADLLPSIPFISSGLVALGGITLLGYIFSRRRFALGKAIQLNPGHILSLLFILWIVLTNPSAAINGRDRNWLFTFAQLFVLSWLATQLLNTRHQQRIFMWIFATTMLASAMVGIAEIITQGGPSLEARSTGLAEGANSAARYFLWAFIFLFYLANQVIKNPVLKLVAFGGMGVLIVGIAYTLSRSVLILLFVTVGLLFFMRSTLSFWKRLLLLLIVAAAMLWFVPKVIYPLMDTVLPAITEGTDTMGTRYSLWEAGYKMWQNHPLAGVGIGEFRFNVQSFSPVIDKRISSHSLYIQVLSETGVVGALLFFALIVSTLLSLLKAFKTTNLAQKSIAQTWLILFIIILLGGITKTELAEKMLWIVIGLGAKKSWMIESQTE